MNGISLEVEAACAICGAPSFPECPHEGERLELALNQALQRWKEMAKIRDWVLNHARDQVILTFHQLRAARYQSMLSYLQTIPCYTLYATYGGHPPLAPAQLAQLHSQISQAQSAYQAGVDADWRRSCQRYPEVLDYYFGLVDVIWPKEKDPAILQPRFGGGAAAGGLGDSRQGKLKARRDSGDWSGSGHQRKERRKSRGRTPPPAPMAAMYGRR